MTQPDNLSFGTAIPDDFGGIAEFAGDAEDLGFDRLSMGEHVMDGDPPRPTVLSITAMAAAAGATRGIRLLTGIVLIPLYPPVLLAKLVASLDVISGGRLDFGIGIGGQRNTRVEFDAVGVPAEERGRRANEMLDLLPRLWTEDRVSFDGRYYRCQGVTLLPRPVQKPYPPIWVAGREDAAMDRAVRQGDGWYPYLYTVRRLRASVEKISERAAEVRRDMSGFHWGLLQPTCIADTKEEALGMAAASVGRRYATPQRSAEDIAQALCITGTPQDCIIEVEKRIEAGARDIVFSWIAPEAKDAWRQMKRAAEEVVPYFR